MGRFTKDLEMFCGESGFSPKTVFCLLRRCWKPMLVCGRDRECRAQLKALGRCLDRDREQMMLNFIAALSQAYGRLLELFTAMGESGCLPEPVPRGPVPVNRDRIAPVKLADLEGDWYVVRSLNRVYDCWDGQRYAFRRVSDTVATYDYTYFPVERKKTYGIQCTVTAIPFAPGEDAVCPGRFRVNYRAYGMPGVDDWYVLSRPESGYVLIYYCGASPMDAYVGGVVLSRSLATAIPPDIEEELAAALSGAGIPSRISFADFSTPDNSDYTPADYR